MGAVVVLFREGEPYRQEKVLGPHKRFDLVLVGFGFHVDPLEFFFSRIVGGISYQQRQDFQTFSTVAARPITGHLANILVDLGGICLGARFGALCLWFTLASLVLNRRWGIAVHAKASLEFSLVGNSFSLVLFQLGTNPFAFAFLLHLFSFSGLGLSLALSLIHFLACLRHFFAHEPALFFSLLVIDLFGLFSLGPFGLEEGFDFEQLGRLFFGRPRLHGFR
mmetsp:Transcript_20174/g.41572  ORF Transcript_20174/g.41572 Transcript_20174/m.41572 type:complete len:222 (+) Transcript_20174:219-884(+)